HMTLVPRIVELLKENEADDVLVFCGGTIPKEDIPKLKEAGVGEVFTPGTPTRKAVEYLHRELVS
ncbi:MAG: methylmalonyl-CoA mutase, partial [Actinomycetota bacterium]|nr:methylmalonyl-CoA mutase [Actinomycetota bacterium]